MVSRCQYQNQRISLYHIHGEIPFTIIILLIDERLIHSYKQLTYLSMRDCKMNYLLYSTRPKKVNSIHIDIYEDYGWIGRYCTIQDVHLIYYFVSSIWSVMSSSKYNSI